MVGFRRTLLCAFGLLISLALPCKAQEGSQSVAEQSPATALGLTAETLPKVDSSTSAQPLAMTIVCEALAVNTMWTDKRNMERWLMPTEPDGISTSGHLVRVGKSGKLEVRHYPGKVRTSGTHGAWERLIKSEADIIFVARKPSPDELALASELSIDLDYRPVALDAFVFVVNDLNPIESLTTEQIQGIYTGRFTLWTELGIKPAREIPQIVEFCKRRVTNARWEKYFSEGGKADRIVPYQRNRNSGSQQLMLSLVMKDIEMAVPRRSLIGMTMISVYDNLARDHTGIAYTVYFYEKNMAIPRSEIKATFPSDGDLHWRDHKVIAVNGIVPNTETLTSLEYPFTTEVYVAIRADTPEDDTARKLRDFLLTPEGQELVAKSGYVPYTPLGD